MSEIGSERSWQREYTRRQGKAAKKAAREINQELKEIRERFLDLCAKHGSNDAGDPKPFQVFSANLHHLVPEEISIESLNDMICYLIALMVDVRRERALDLAEQNAQDGNMGPRQIGAARARHDKRKVGRRAKAAR